MPIFKRLIQLPYPPDKDLKTAGGDRYKQSTFAKLADVNVLSKDVNDQKAYTLALSAAANNSGTPLSISTKKGVVKITTTNTGTLTIYLSTTSTSELLVADVDKYFVCATITCGTAGVVAYAMANPITTNNQITFQLIQTGTATAWGTCYLNYNIVKIGD